MSTIYGQSPHFNNSDPYFDPIGESYPVSNSNGLPTLKSGGKGIFYGSSSGSSRKSFCIRRYVYQYNFINKNFIFYKTYKGVRNFEQPNNVIDIDELNARSLIHSTEILTENEPSFITQSILNSLFSFPSDNDYFFVEGVHSIRGGHGVAITGSNFFKIYRYGKITQNNIILIYKNNHIERRESI